MSSHTPKVDPVSKLLFLGALVAILLVVYILLSSLVNTYKRNSTKGEADSSYLVELASDNLKPVGVSATSDAVAAAPAAARSGKEVFTTVCTVCHTAGVAGAPKVSDKAAWEPRVATGLDALMNTAINGKGAMPARGGNPSVTDAELKATIIYMTTEAGFNLGGGAAPVAKKEAPAPAAKTEETKKEEAPVAKVEEAKVEEKPAEVAVPTPASEPEAQPAPAEPVAPVAAAPAVAEAPSAPASLEVGKKVYDKVCFVCHATGVAGSPILGNKEQWAPRIATGMDALYHTALTGKGAMPPKGGNTTLSDDDVKAAVDFIVSKGK